MTNGHEDKLPIDGEAARLLPRTRAGVSFDLDQKGDLDEGEQLYLDGLSDLVADYEDEHHAIEPASDADMLRHLMEARGITQAQLH
nr:hypothetical protein [Pirellulaceae bacterium]